MPLSIHWAAVAAAMVAGVLVNGLWYAKFMLGSQWQTLSGLDGRDLKQGFPPRLALAFACSFLSAWCLEGFFNFTGSATFLQGSLAGLELFLGLVAPAMATEHIFGQRPVKLLLINLGAAGLSLLAQGGLLGAWT
jgi:hypothetical protein